ncbi:hypothetical protein CHCC20491_1122 [Bacillus paralicheniformis]|uniref:Uncharacterized protein n=1 Tax=Bacillus paralicheniformis TaxID=1648923 RepID=A0ABY3FQ07_9BACI|nr:hypothetical protein CHCC20333_1310 [Bacillus paralicheniformis]TWL33664.1 hypothetical protein CHCC15381_0171 [Bacillus paralicheniformis]TWN92471.1 hypothetical protein CHCC20491_1122 [Bacillus paralicheniformis]
MLSTRFAFLRLSRFSKRDSLVSLKFIALLFPSCLAFYFIIT